MKTQTTRETHRFIHLCKSGNILRGTMVQVGPSQFEWSGITKRKLSLVDIIERDSAWIPHVAGIMAEMSEAMPGYHEENLQVIKPKKGKTK